MISPQQEARTREHRPSVNMRIQDRSASVLSSLIRGRTTPSFWFLVSAAARCVWFCVGADFPKLNMMDLREKKERERERGRKRQKNGGGRSALLLLAFWHGGHHFSLLVLLSVLTGSGAVAGYTTKVVQSSQSFELG